MKIEGDFVIFSTGKILVANRGFIALGPKADYATEGWDAGLESYDNRDRNYLTDAERVELADYMIALWNKYKTTKRS